MLNSAALSNKTIMGRLLRFPLRLLPPEMKVPILQGLLRGKKWIAGSSNHGCWIGVYEYEKRRLFEKTIRWGSIVFDVGAHVGFYTLLASELVGPNGKVFAFEPLPRNIFYLKEHLRLNHVFNVEIIKAAVTDHQGSVCFNEGPHSTMGHIAAHGNHCVKAISIDGLVKEGKVPSPDYVKVDVEGAELSVLGGAKSTLSAATPTIFLATHGDVIQKKCRDFLQSLDYELEAINGGDIGRAKEILARPRGNL